MKSIQQLITDHIDIWTAAESEKKTGRGRSRINSDAVYGIKKLRELILDLAVQGKLVSQNSTDEPASELLKRIQNEKNGKSAPRKLKDAHANSSITDAEKPFYLPLGWAWTRLDSIIDYVNGFAFSSKDFTLNGIGIIKIGDIQLGRIEPENMSRVREEIVADLDEQLIVEPGDLVIAMSGATTGKLGFNDTKERFYLNQRVGKIVPFTISKKFLYFDLTTKIADNLQKSSGTAIPNLSTEQIKSIVIALPPLAEQHRIVAKVDELMSLCDQLESEHINAAEAHVKLVSHLLGTLTQSKNAEDFNENWQRIAEHFDILFTTESSIDALKQTLLQLAVIGALTSSTKVRTPDMFNTKFENILEGTKGSLRRGPFGSSIRKDMFVDSGFKVYEQKNAIQDDCNLGTYYINKQKFDELSNFAVLPGDFIVSCAGTIGKISYLPSHAKPGVINQALMRIRINKAVINDQFFIKLFESSYFQTSILETTKGSAMKNLAAVKTIKNINIWLPDLDKQRQIVDKINELEKLCNKLEKRIRETSQLQRNLADTLVSHGI